MPTDDDTDPDLDPREAPTQPDLMRVLCPRCKGEGHVLDLTEWATGHKAVARTCGLCHGEKRVDRQTLAAHHATRQGRPPRT